MKNLSAVSLTASLFLFTFSISAKENINQSTIVNSQQPLRAGCAPATAIVDLDINNVRAKILAGGDMWWDLTNAGYEIPAGSGKHSLFAGSLWIGGLDAGGQLKLAAQTYRQTGNDYFPGPLDPSTATTDASQCLDYDRLFKINKSSVITYHNWVLTGSIGPCPISTTELFTIQNWPVTGPMGQMLAPYFDFNNDGVYNPAAGDYPDFNLSNSSNCSHQLNGNEVLWWVFNDAGNIHTESGGSSIGLEIQAQAFAFATNDEINNATFYKYKIKNMSSFFLYNTYFGQFADPDIGTFGDDYIGCDVERGLGYCYNGNNTDGIYGSNPPALGIDFLEGPYADSNGIDNSASTVPASFSNYGDGIVDNERLGMKKFVYYNNDNTSYGNPTTALHYYNYLKGMWKNNTSMTYGGNGHSTSTLVCNYMFPGTSDPIGWGVGGTAASPSPQASWTESGVPLSPGDRRFLESAGPFTLQPGAINYITTAVLWAKATSGGPLASVAALKVADDKAQALYNNCFSITTEINNIKSDELNVKIYPNPFYESAVITINGSVNKNFTLSVYDMQGKLVRTYNNVKGTFSINKEGLNSGTYLYSLEGQETQPLSGKFIIK
ncbi:MAG: hypothetical protein K0S44_1540 [Bacteroidetes bacterium]|jgi:hypothetical protein|nr:hypothetical protein [Bacteroidota bacterium]